MDKSSDPNRIIRFLHPPIEPFDQRMIETGQGHKIYVEQCGNPKGIPVIVVHGGPGGGCSPAMRRYFDPKVYRVILFDQRGCGRSRPFASVLNNTTWHLVDDMERIRRQLSIEKWITFGGSWGATLSLVYAQAHPDRVMRMVLRGVFLATQTELDWFYGGGAARFWPDTWEKFIAPIPEDERTDLIAAYHKRLFCGDVSTEMRYARAWSAWENALASIQSSGQFVEGAGDYAHAFSRLENHYFSHNSFLKEDGQILNDVPKIAHIPAVIVQGRFDMICPPVTAWRLAKNWSNCELRMIRQAGHALSETQISGELVRIMDQIAEGAC
jgi:proline iminopeptidase